MSMFSFAKMKEYNSCVSLILLLVLLQLLDSYVALPLCTDLKAPFTLSSPLEFCAYNGTSCCSHDDDLRLQEQFRLMNVSDPGCSSVVKSILCSRCDQFSAELFRVKSVPREVPVLCNNSVSSTSAQSDQASIIDFCSLVWSACWNVSIFNSPFAASLKGQAGAPVSSNSTKLIDLWQSQRDFCSALGAASEDGLPCFNGAPVTLNGRETPPPPSGMCLDKIGNGSYLNMAAHPDGSNRAFFANQQGKIWLATIPKPGSRGLLELDEASPFLDITDQVHFGTQFGLMGMAFHPKFTENGRFFASFNCDKAQWPDCAGRCACNTDVDCDPSKLNPDDGSDPCQYHSVISEFTVNGSNSQPSQASARPSEVRRIFTMGLPFTSHHAGQILFGPQDSYLYFMMGDGGGTGDPYNFAQNKKSLLGKIMRLDIDTIPSASEIDQLELWGNYSIPSDNPYVLDEALQKEIWAMGLRNPWRCSFDSARPSYFICADVGQDRYEEVDLITKDGNYGWHLYEGPLPYSAPQSLAKNATVTNSTNLIYPVMGYYHPDVNSNQGSASITGGYFYRSTTDPCMHGRYLYADLFGAIWAGTENPPNSGNFSSGKIAFTCAKDSPLPCTFIPGSKSPALSYIFSFGEDNNKDVYLLTNSGVYRIVCPSRCGYTCANENACPPTVAASTPHSNASPLRDQCWTAWFGFGFGFQLLLLFLSFLEW